MIPYQLPSGKTVFVDALDLLNSPESAIQDLIADDSGVYLDPFTDAKGQREAIHIGIDAPDIADVEELDLDTDIE